MKTHLSELQEARWLPTEYYSVMDAVHPGVFQLGWRQTLLKSIVNGHNVHQCPCYQLAEMNEAMLLKGRGLTYGFQIASIASIASEYEQSLGQKRCTNALLERSDFMNGHVGSHDAAKGYFGKELESLTRMDWLKLIVIQSNPALYNPLRRQQRITQKANELEKKLFQK
ncbi:MAG: transglycosylase domain-containing protein [Flavobacteriales bacterium]|nr:transglycosylase domain-containing protein [Flavobacteriales bacterium]